MRRGGMWGTFFFGFWVLVLGSGSRVCVVVVVVWEIVMR